MKKIITLLLSFFVIVLDVAGQAPLVSLQDGKLKYTLYANQGQENAVNQVPDFSSAGYRGGGVKLPDVPVKETISPDTGDVRALIQGAIDRVAALPADANGFRGAVLLKAGIYHVEGALFVRESGVVLRGEGNGLNGTVLIATQRAQHNLIEVRGTGSGFGEVTGTKVRITSAYVPTGAKTFSVANHTFKVGDEVVVQKTPNDAWINALDMAQYGWVASDYKTQFERKIVAVNGNAITLDAPIVDPIETVYGGGEVYKSNVAGRISETGVENMRLESVFRSNSDESHGWNAVQFNRVENSWVKNVVVKYFGYSAVRLSNMSRFNTIQDCAMIDPKSQTTGSRKYSFNLESNSSNNLFQRCMTWGGRHDYVTGSRVPGPNVFLDCFSDNTQADIGPHHRWATGLLFDNVYGGQIRVRNRGASGTGHGWSGAQSMFWNSQSYKSDFLVESPPTARNWAVGSIGVTQGVGEDPAHNGYWESWGTHVPLRSLYLQQLRERLGEQAVNNIVIPEQLQGNLWAALRVRTEQILAEEPVYQEPAREGDPEAFDLTDNGGILTSQYESNRPDEGFKNIIDNDTNTKYYQNGKKALWVQYQSAVQAIVTSYTITSGRDQEERDPKDWNLKGSNDGKTWTTLDTRSNEDFPTRKQTRTFSIADNTQSFVYYRLNITMNGNNNNTQFAEWELFQRKTQEISFGEITEVTYGDDPFQFVASASSGQPVTLAVLSGPATIETNDGEDYLRITGAGTVTVQATQAGDEKYFPVTASQTFVVNRAAQEITFEAITPKNAGESITLSAVSSAGLPVSYSVVSGPGSVAGNTLTFSGDGQVLVQADQAGDDNYEAAAPVQQTILVFVEDAKKDGLLLVAYPNPTQGRFKVKLDNRKDKEYTFAIYDSNGNLVTSSVLAKSHKMFEIDFNLQQNLDGYYYLHVSDGTEVWVRRILKR
ncbi:T9SS type A sorting domain-containing protein [Pontibacter flavimaris]|uniref:Secretion system C-terminal sorting domain-containing protein n=1 Tax=Pontibacter flavimaris TaxID=1797110 RepID=A0A1Q5PHZ8_9BACT|nr:T9SS type A sorting domain-containing protein [Pontibacter flavimaris]OKL41857.1 hypothetical protein A3841_07500 [Pontibacter flavimaris]